MTKSTNKKTTKVKLSAMSEADQVRALSALLKAQPDIFQKEPKLIENLNFGDQKIGNVTMLANRQTERLKEELNKNKSRTQDLLDNARYFDELTNKIYALIYDLMPCEDINEMLDIVAKRSSDLFNVDFVEFKSTLVVNDLNKAFELTNFFDTSLDSHSDYQHIMTRLSQGKCLCSDRFPPSVLNFFFPDHSNDIKSVAFIPLFDKEPQDAFGVLAYGSKDAKKFSSGLRGTIHLERIGKIMALTLKRILNS